MNNILITKKNLYDIFLKASLNIDLEINDINNYIQAFVHNSYSKKMKKTVKYSYGIKDNNNSKILNNTSAASEASASSSTIPIFDNSNESLELLGDGILQSIVVLYLWKRFPNEDEGFLTILRSRIVKTETLAKLAKYYEFDKYVIISEEVEASNNGRNNSHILEDCFEAFLGALYIDFGERGFEICQKFVINTIESVIDFVEILTKDDNYKDQLMRLFQKKFDGKYPIYCNNIDLDDGINIEKKFSIYVKHPYVDVIIGKGYGQTKQKAEQFSAKQGLYFLNHPKNAKYLEIKNPNPNPNDKKSEEKSDNTDEKSDDEKENVKIVIYNENNKIIKKKDITNICKVKKINDINVFVLAFTHNSYTNNTEKNKKYNELIQLDENKDMDFSYLFTESNDRLKWLGDGIIQGVVGSYLWLRYPDEDEGFLTKLRSKLVKTDMLYKLAKEHKMEEYILISKYIEDYNNGRDNKRILENTFKAFIAALLLNEKSEIDGFKKCYEFIINSIETYVDLTELILTDDNYKDQLMKEYQKKFSGKYPVYQQISFDKEKKIYTMCVLNPKTNMELCRGEATTKQKAEQIAAQKALNIFHTVMK